jgi:hypothetical protein
MSIVARCERTLSWWARRDHHARILSSWMASSNLTTVQAEIWIEPKELLTFLTKDKQWSETEELKL